jgi:hypothetical protein
MGRRRPGRSELGRLTGRVLSRRRGAGAETGTMGIEGIWGAAGGAVTATAALSDAEEALVGGSGNGPSAVSRMASSSPPRSAVNIARCCSFMSERTMAETSSLSECST